MNRNSQNSRESFLHAGYQNPRWRNVFIALVLALAIGSGGQTPLAYAAPHGATSLRFFMLANKERPGQVCVGELVHINVLVYRYKLIDGVSDAPDTITGVEVAGNVDNPDVGQLLPSMNTTIWASSIYPGAADFVFTAEKPGNTTITFYALVATPGWFGTKYGGGARQVSAEVDVNVVPCKFKVTTIGQWNVPGPANIAVAAISDDAEVRAAAAQSPLTGSTTVNWVASSIGVGDCPPAVIEIGSSQVEWSGELNDADQLTLQGTYLPTQGSVSVSCGTSGTVPIQLTPDPLQVSVASSGGVFKQSQVLQGPEATPGYVTVIVFPQEDEAAAFSPDSRAALDPLEWLARLWHNFPWLYNPVLALR